MEILMYLIFENSLKKWLKIKHVHMYVYIHVCAGLLLRSLAGMVYLWESDLICGYPCYAAC